MSTPSPSLPDSAQVRIPVGPRTLAGALAIPEAAKGVVLFAHGSGSSRFSRRNQIVAGEVRRAGLAVRAVVSRGGRSDLAAGALPHVQAPTLLIVGGLDPEVLKLNRNAFARLRCPAELVVIPGATHLFEEPGTLAEVSNLAAAWFRTHLRPQGAEEAPEPLGVTAREG